MSFILDALTREQRDRKSPTLPTAEVLLALEPPRPARTAAPGWQGPWAVVALVLAVGTGWGLGMGFQVKEGNPVSEAPKADPAPPHPVMPAQPAGQPPLPQAAPLEERAPVTPLAASPMPAVPAATADLSRQGAVAAVPPTASPMPVVPSATAVISRQEVVADQGSHPAVSEGVPASRQSTTMSTPLSDRSRDTGPISPPVTGAELYAERIQAYVVGITSGCDLEVKFREEDRKITLAHVSCPQPTTPEGRAARSLTTRAAFTRTVTLGLANPLGMTLPEVDVLLEDGTLLNRLLVAKGLAHARDARFAVVEETARAQRMGMWEVLAP